MSEYMERHAVSRLVGAPPGYVGYEEGGQLTEPVRRRPYSVILFDEIEKAHPDVFNTLLQILDDGRLTDGQGRTVDFTNTVIILTSNIASAQLSEVEERRDLDDDQKDTMRRQVVAESLRKVFRPEFINRLDEVAVYRRLDRDQIRSIVDIQLGNLQKRLSRRDLSLQISTAAKDLLAKLGWDPEFGARPLKRAIQKHLEDRLAERVLSGELAPGNTVTVDVKDGELTIASTPAAAASSKKSDVLLN
jgi:ATP-dependent Clp protease ATP-binding subunit ClpB